MHGMVLPLFFRRDPLSPLQDCADVVASKFFPIEGPDGRQHPLCERDYFRRLNLICAKCGMALRGSYITACSSYIPSDLWMHIYFLFQTRSSMWNTLHALSVLPCLGRRIPTTSTTVMYTVIFTIQLVLRRNAPGVIAQFSNSSWRSIATCETNAGIRSAT